MPLTRVRSKGENGLEVYRSRVFAISGALTAARYRMDVLGFVLIGTITGIGGAWSSGCFSMTGISDQCSHQGRASNDVETR